MNIGWQIPVVHPIDTTRPPMKTMPTTIATVTVTLIAAFLSPAMRLVNAWNLPWRFLKCAIAKRKISEQNSSKLPESELRVYKEDFFFFKDNNNNQSLCQRGLCASRSSHSGGLYICTILVVWLHQLLKTIKGKKIFSFAIDDNRIPKCQVRSMLYPLSVQGFSKPLIAVNTDFPIHKHRTN